MIKPFRPYIFVVIVLLSQLCLLQCAAVSNNTASKTLEINEDLSFTSLVNLLKVQKLPYLDSSNLGAPDHQFVLNKEWIKKLKLEKLDKRILSANTVSIKHKLDICNSFITLVITHQPNENELFTSLINYTKKGELIDFIPIAYDEIAESCHSTSALIKPHKITVYKKDYCYNQKTDTLKYKINKLGQIKDIT